MLTEGLNTLESHQPRALPTKLKLNWRCPAINEVGDFLDYVKPTTRSLVRTGDTEQKEDVKLCQRRSRICLQTQRMRLSEL